MNVKEAIESVELAKRVIDLVMEKAGQNIVQAMDNPRDGSPESEAINNAYDGGFQTARECFDISVDDLDIEQLIKAIGKFHLSP